MSDVDTSAEAVERVAAALETANLFDAPHDKVVADLLRRLLAERDAAEARAAAAERVCEAAALYENGGRWHVVPDALNAWRAAREAQG